MNAETALTPAAARGATEATEAPRLVDTYSYLYAATLLALVPAGLGMALSPMYSYTPLYTLMALLPPLFGMLFVLVTDPGRSSVASLLGRTALLAALSLGGSLLVIFGGALLLAPISGWLRPENFGAFVVAAVAILAVLVAPLVFVLVRTLREQRSVAGWVRAAVIVLALVGLAVAVYYSFAPGRVLATALRKDQGSFLMGAITWYIPAYAACGAIARKVGLG